MQIFKTLKDRWNAETPILYKKIRNYCIGLSGSATALLALGNTANIIIPVIVTKAASWILIVSAATGGYAQLQKNKDDN